MRCWWPTGERRYGAAGTAVVLVFLAVPFPSGCHERTADRGGAGGAGAGTSQTALLGHDPEQARRQNERAFEFFRQGKYADAEPLLRMALEADPSYGPALNNLGLAHYKLGRLYDAAWEFENAVRLMPQQPEPQNNLGLVLERAGKWSAAIASYEKAHALAPDNPEYLGNLARAHVRNGDSDEPTRALLQQVVRSDPRPQWQAWARSALLRLRPPATGPAADPAPAARP